MQPTLLCNLVEFDRGFLVPSASAFSQAESQRSKAHTFVEIVAGYFWLLFGLDAEYFPDDHAQSLFGQRFMQLINELGGLYATWGYVFDQEFGPLLFTAYSQRRPIQRAEELRVHGHPIARASIRSALIAETKLKQSAAAQTFMSLLIFDTEMLMRIIASGHASSSEGEIDQNTVTAGFQDVVSYMRVLVELSDGLRRDRQEDQVVADRCALRIRQLTRWRVNRHRAVDGPFKEVALFVNSRAMGGAYSEAEVIHEIENLLGDWGFTHLRALTSPWT